MKEEIQILSRVTVNTNLLPVSVVSEMAEYIINGQYIMGHITRGQYTMSWGKLSKVSTSWGTLSAVSAHYQWSVHHVMGNIISGQYIMGYIISGQ